MRRSRVRLRTMIMGVAAIAVVCTVLPGAWVLFPTFHSRTGGGGKVLPLEVLVVEEGTGTPIAGASVVVRHPHRPDLNPPKRAVTGEDGRAEVEAVAGVSGRFVTAEVEAIYRIPIWSSERVSFVGGSVSASAEGRKGDEIALSPNCDRAAIVIPLRPGRQRPGTNERPRTGRPRG